jgi:hypothetical protein
MPTVAAMLPQHWQQTTASMIGAQALISANFNASGRRVASLLPMLPLLPPPGFHGAMASRYYAACPVQLGSQPIGGSA